MKQEILLFELNNAQLLQLIINLSNQIESLEKRVDELENDVELPTRPEGSE